MKDTDKGAPCDCGGQGLGLNGFHYPLAEGCLRIEDRRDAINRAEWERLGMNGGRWIEDPHDRTNYLLQEYSRALGRLADIFAEGVKHAADADGLREEVKRWKFLARDTDAEREADPRFGWLVKATAKIPPYLHAQDPFSFMRRDLAITFDTEAEAEAARFSVSKRCKFALQVVRGPARARHDSERS